MPNSVDPDHWLKKPNDLDLCLFVLRFYGPINPMGSCRERSIYLATRLLGRLSPQWLTSIVYILLPETDNCTVLLDSAEGREIDILLMSTNIFAENVRYF